MTYFGLFQQSFEGNKYHVTLQQCFARHSAKRKKGKPLSKEKNSLTFIITQACWSKCAVSIVFGGLQRLHALHATVHEGTADHCPCYIEGQIPINAQKGGGVLQWHAASFRLSQSQQSLCYDFFFKIASSNFLDFSPNSNFCRCLTSSVISFIFC